MAVPLKVLAFHIISSNLTITLQVGQSENDHFHFTSHLPHVIQRVIDRIVVNTQFGFNTLIQDIFI